MARTPKGEVTILNKDGWIQLRWRYQGKRCYLSPGLRYDPINLQVAQQKAAQIRLDMASGNYDQSRRKYKSESPQQHQSIGAVELFQRFIDWKVKRVDKRTLEKYHGLLTWLKEFFGERPATVEDASSFMEWLRENLAPVTAKERLGLLKAGWDWGIQNQLLLNEENVWQELEVRQSPKQRPQAFTKDEVKQIIQGFEESRYSVSLLGEVHLFTYA